MLTQRENDLFERWKRCIPDEVKECFIPDGVVNEKRWDAGGVKVLFFLKEVNGGENWDEREYLAGYNSEQKYIKTHSATIDSLIQWVYGIVSDRNEPWSTIVEKTKDKSLQDELLSGICLVNAKKVSGGGVVDWNKFDGYMKQQVNQKLLLEQLDLYNPDVFVCGNTAWILEKIDSEKFAPSKWQQTTRGIRYLKEGRCAYIDFVHPNIRAPKSLAYYALVDTIKEIREKE